jgi:hypothetical protein
LRSNIVCLMAAVLLAVTAPPAAAGSFNVYGLGANGAGCGSGWVAETSAPSKFTQADHCSRWTIRSNREGPLNTSHYAGANLYAGAGARFTSFSIRSTGTVQNGVRAAVFTCARPWDSCQGGTPLSGSWNDVEIVRGGNAQHVFAGVWCYEAKCPDSVSAGRAASIDYHESHAVVEDYTPPAAPSLSGVSTGWNSGQRRLAYGAADAGSGIDTVFLTIDGSLHRANNHTCARLPGVGYSRPVPCATSTSGEFDVNQPGQLADGPHSLTVTTRDAGWATGVASQQFLVDNNAPGHPVGLAVVGGEAWRGVNDFAVGWESPDQGSGSPVVGAYWRVGSPPGSPTDGTRIAGEGVSKVDGIRVPGDGDWVIEVWLEDAAGNVYQRNAASAHLRLDTTPPSLAFSDARNEHDPAEVRVDASDASSGVAGGQVDIRRQGTAEWHPLETQREGTDLVARIPDDRLERGTYELQATGWDAVGNRAVTSVRADGQQMVVDLPLRGDTHLSAWLARGGGGAQRALPTIRVGYGRRAWLRGVLRSGSGAVLGDTPLAVATRRPGAQWRPFSDVVTGPNGRYAIRLPRGASRELLVYFAGTRALRPSYDVAKLRVRGWTSLRLKPRRLRRGRTISFVGRVGLRGTRVPRGGKLVQIQYLDGRTWRPAVKLGRTNSRGRFRIRYRFRRISRPTTIRFRILVPAEGGWPYATGASRVRKAFVRP